MAAVECCLHMAADYRVESYYIQASNSSGIIGIAFQKFYFTIPKIGNMVMQKAQGKRF